jgi:hypothetical protein
MPLGKLFARDLDEMCGLLTREGIDVRLRIIGRSQVPTETQGRVGLKQFVFDGLSQEGAQGASDAAHRGHLQPFGATRSDEIATIAASQ